MRSAQLAHEFEVLARIEGIDRALAVVGRQRGEGLRSDAHRPRAHLGRAWWAAVEPRDPWDAALAVAPPRARLCAMRGATESLLVLADFADLKSPWSGGHSRAVATLALDACGPVAEAAALLHDLGASRSRTRSGTSPVRWRATKHDRAETHTLVTGPARRVAGPTPRDRPIAACGAHERTDGSGYHRHVGGSLLDEAQRVDRRGRLLSGHDVGPPAPVGPGRPNRRRPSSGP